MYPRYLDQVTNPDKLTLPDVIIEFLKTGWYTVREIKRKFLEYYDGEAPSSGTIIRMMDNTYSIGMTDDKPAKYKIVTDDDRDEWFDSQKNSNKIDDKPKLNKIPVINMEETGKRLKNLRLSRNASVNDILKLFNFDYPQAIYKWEQGKMLPTVDHLLILAKFYNMSIEDLLVIKEVNN